MNEKLLRDGLEIATKTILKLEKSKGQFNIWFYIAIIELAIIFYLLIRKNDIMRSSLIKVKKEALSHEIDFDNIINSSFHSTKLYDELKLKCHPDKFIEDPEKNEIALRIFQELTKSKTNLKRLEELKKEAEIKLKINI